MLFRKFKRAIDTYQLIKKGDRLIVGVSGGIDSMVLLNLLNDYREALDLFLIVAHVNHGLRPDESDQEADLVRDESKRLGLPFEYGKFDIKGFKKDGGLSHQDAARRVRFQFFYDLLQKHHAQKIALGHHADDQVETILLRIIRGSGLEGLKGMLPIREGKVIRPLLEVWRREIESFALEKKIPFLTDSSNLKEDYLRNRVRLSLIPWIEKELQPNFKKILLRSSIHLRNENDYLERESEEAYQQLVHQERDGFSFKFSEYQSLHQAIQWRVIKKILKNIYHGTLRGGKYEWSMIHQFYQVLQTSSPSFLIELSEGIYGEKRYDDVFLKKGMIERFPPFEVELICPGRTFVEPLRREVVIEETDQHEFQRNLKDPNIAFLDYESLHFPLKLRNFRSGDRFHPLGTKGSQKVKEFFIDHKIPKLERSNIPLLVSGEIIAWIVGHRIDERVKITDKTKRVLKIKII